jgi:hypothetical protein
MAALGSFYVGIGEARDVVGAYGVAGRPFRDHSAAGRDALGLLIGRRFAVSAGHGVVFRHQGQSRAMTLANERRHMAA